MSLCNICSERFERVCLCYKCSHSYCQHCYNSRNITVACDCRTVALCAPKGAIYCIAYNCKRACRAGNPLLCGHHAKKIDERLYATVVSFYNGVEQEKLERIIREYIHEALTGESLLTKLLNKQIALLLGNISLYHELHPGKYVWIVFALERLLRSHSATRFKFPLDVLELSPLLTTSEQAKKVSSIVKTYAYTRNSRIIIKEGFCYHVRHRDYNQQTLLRDIAKHPYGVAIDTLLKNFWSMELIEALLQKNQIIRCGNFVYDGKKYGDLYKNAAEMPIQVYIIRGSCVFPL